MEITNRTREILKNFSTINESIYYSPEQHGKTLVTKSVAGNIIASADIKEAFPKEFAIFNINGFLGVLSMFDKPFLEFSDKYVTIRESGSKRGGVKYFFCNPALIMYPKKKPSAPAFNFEFELKADQLSKIDKSAKILNVEDLILFGDSEGIHVIVTDRKQTTSNDYEVTLSEESAGEFKYYFKQPNWKFISGDYDVGIAVKEGANGMTGIGFFTSKDGTIKYGVGLERV